MLTSQFQLRLVPERLGDAEVRLRVRRVQVQRPLPAEDRLVVHPSGGQTYAHIKVALEALVFVQSSRVKHLFGELMLAELGIAEDSSTIAGLKGGIDGLDLLEG